MKRGATPATGDEDSGGAVSTMERRARSRVLVQPFFRGDPALGHPDDDERSFLFLFRSLPRFLPLP